MKPSFVLCALGLLGLVSCKSEEATLQRTGDGTVLSEVHYYSTNFGSLINYQEERGKLLYHANPLQKPVTFDAKSNNDGTITIKSDSGANCRGLTRGSNNILLIAAESTENGCIPAGTYSYPTGPLVVLLTNRHANFYMDGVLKGTGYCNATQTSELTTFSCQDSKNKIEFVSSFNANKMFPAKLTMNGNEISLQCTDHQGLGVSRSCARD